MFQKINFRYLRKRYFADPCSLRLFGIFRSSLNILHSFLTPCKFTLIALFWNTRSKQQLVSRKAFSPRSFKINALLFYMSHNIKTIRKKTQNEKSAKIVITPIIIAPSESRYICLVHSGHLAPVIGHFPSRIQVENAAICGSWCREKRGGEASSSCLPPTVAVPSVCTSVPERREAYGAQLRNTWRAPPPYARIKIVPFAQEISGRYVHSPKRKQEDCVTGQVEGWPTRLILQ